MVAMNNAGIDTLRRLAQHVSARRKRQLVILLTLMVLGALAELLSLGAVVPFITVLANPARAAAVPMVAQLMQLTEITQAQLPLTVSVLFGALVLFAAATRLSLLWASIKFANGLGAEVGCTLYSRTLERPYTFHVSRNTSEIIGSMNKVQRLIGGYILPLLTSFTASVLATAIVLTLVFIEPVVALAGAGIFGASYLLIATAVRKRLRQDGLVSARANDDRIQALQEGLGGIRDVILDRAQPIYTRRFARIEERFRRAQARTQFYSGFPRLAIEAIGLLLLSGFAAFYGNTGKDFETLLPVLGALAVGAQKLLPLVQQIYNGWSSAVASQVAVTNVLDLLDYRAPTAGDSPEIHFHGEIRLRDVGFHYSAAANSTAVLHNIDLDIRRGQKIGIVGATGSGKSTLVDLVMGLLLPTTGSFTVDGREVTPGNAGSWQRHIAHVPQTIYLSDASIAENIAFGVDPKKIDMDRLKAVARIAQIHDHVTTLPNGYQTTVGERGVRLSGGQRQRIGIARALYKRVDVLVLDEATSALDDATESRLMNELSRTAGGMTVIMIAHRLTTMQWCDRIVHLEQGRIQRMSSYGELMAVRAPQVTHA